MKIYLILVLLFLPLVSAIEDCITIQPFYAKNSPCMIITPYPYEVTCDQLVMRIHNQEGQLIGMKNMTDYGITGQCNQTFNYTELGNYQINISNGESIRILIEKEDNMLSIVIGFVIIAVFFAIMGYMSPGDSVKSLSLRIFCYGMALIEVISIAFMIYAKESGGSLLTVLKVNFFAMMILGFAIGMLALINLTTKAINPNSKDDEEGKKWSSQR